MERALVDQLRESVFKGRSAVYQPRWVQGSSSNKGQEIPVGGGCHSVTAEEFQLAAYDSVKGDR